MNKMVCLDERYSTTRMLFKIVNDECLKKDRKIKEECKWNINNLEFNIKNSKLIGNSEDKFETVLFLPEGEGRKGEGGLRTKGYFKKSYKDKPLISIITVVFNGEKFLEETIQSVINQSYDNVEYIIIDGGSTDGTLDIIKKYEDRIDYWISEKDSGISDAFNKGIICCFGELIGILNADDYYEKDAFLNVINTYLNLDKNSPAILYGKTYKITTKSEKLVKKDNKRSWCMSVPFSHCSSFITKSYYKKFGLYNIAFKIAMDIELLMRGLKIVNYISLENFIATQRDGGISDINRIKGYKEYIKASKGYCSFIKSYMFYIIKVLLVYKNKVLL